MLACFHFPVFAIECVWESILEDGACEAEQSAPVVSTETIPGELTLTPWQVRATGLM